MFNYLKGVNLNQEVRYGEFSYSISKLLQFKGQGIKTKVPVSKLIVNDNTVNNSDGCIIVTQNAENFVVLTMSSGATAMDEVNVIIFSKVLLKNIRNTMLPIIAEPVFQNNPRFTDNRNRDSRYNNGYQDRNSGYGNRY